MNKSGQIIAPGNIKKQVENVCLDLAKLLKISGSGWRQIVQMNIVIRNRNDLPHVLQHLKRLIPHDQFPAVTLIAGELPHTDALLGIDLVAATSQKMQQQVRIINHPDVYRRPGQSHIALLNWGETIYLSGWVHRGKTKDVTAAVRETLKFQHQLLKQAGSDLKRVVRLRVFLKPESERDAVEIAISEFFNEQKHIPPVVYTPWQHKRTPEIELIAAGNKTSANKTKHVLEYINVPQLKASPVFSRAVRVRSDQRIFICGLHGNKVDQAETQVKKGFDRLQHILERAGSDLNHLVKATYFMGNRKAFSALTSIRQKRYHPARPPAASGFLADPNIVPGSQFTMDMIAVPKPKKQRNNKEQTKSKNDRNRFQVASGFRIELVAAEPLLRDPVAIAFDESGKMFVVEYPEYNQQFSEKKAKAQGSVRQLEDTNGDGKYDKSTVFLSNLSSPSAVACYNGGIFVAAAPDVMFCKDTDGDGKADVIRRVFTGFRRLENRTDPSLNSFHWGLDNHFHACTSYSGANVSAISTAESKPRSVGNRNFLFDPKSLQFELSSGGGQHGLAFDDWGREFLCTNSSPIRQLIYDDRYLLRNPYLRAPAPAVEITESGKHTKLFRISPEEPWRVERTRLRSAGLLAGSDEGGKSSGFFTSASGVTVYRGNAFPDHYRGTVFVAEPANNLIYRAALSAKGIELIARRADEQSEFVASTDTKFRPVQFANAPDGTLYVIDMHRELIEGAMFLPKQILKDVDVTGSTKRGRIYRIVPDNFRQPAAIALGAASTQQLVALLEHRNGWHRDTAARLLYERQNFSAVKTLKKLAHHSLLPLARMTALHVLDGMQVLDSQTILKSLADADENVRIHALRLAEQRLSESPELQNQLKKMTTDPKLSVRYQLAFSLGALPDVQQRNAALSHIILQDCDHKWMRLAVQSSAFQQAGKLFQLIADEKDFRTTAGGRTFLISLCQQIGAQNNLQDIHTVVHSLKQWPQQEHPLKEMIVLALLEKLNKQNRQYLEMAMQTTLYKIQANARATANNPKGNVSQRVAAILKLAYSDYHTEQNLLQVLLEPQQPHPVQSAALATLGKLQHAHIADLLIKHWAMMTPSLRKQTVEILSSRSVWLSTLLDAIQKGNIRPGEIEPARVELLKKHPDSKIKNRVLKLFASKSLQRRDQVVKQYQAALQLTGDHAKGKQVFKKICSACHRLDGIGTAIGADLKSIRDRDKSAIMLNILDPNRVVKPQYFSYTVLDTNGRIVTGMIANESVNSITIRKNDGTQANLLRVNIEELRSSGLSFMPEGLEKQLSLQSMADLLSYLLKP